MDMLLVLAGYDASGDTSVSGIDHASGVTCISGFGYTHGATRETGDGYGFTVTSGSGYDASGITSGSGYGSGSGYAPGLRNEKQTQISTRGEKQAPAQRENYTANPTQIQAPPQPENTFFPLCVIVLIFIHSLYVTRQKKKKKNPSNPLMIEVQYRGFEAHLIPKTSILYINHDRI